MIAEGFKKA